MFLASYFFTSQKFIDKKTIVFLSLTGCKNGFFMQKRKD